MDEKVTELDFVADAIIVHLRRGNRPTDNEVALLDRRPLIDALRQCIKLTDTELLLKIIDSESEAMGGLACSLLRHHVSSPSVKSFFEERWKTAGPYLKNRLMWRMLDDPNLSTDWHKHFFAFVLAEWETFRNFNLAFYGNSQTALSSILTRITDPSFPDSKKWIYLCCPVEVVDDSDATKAIVLLGQALQDSFSRHVSEVLIQRFYTTETEGHTTVEITFNNETDIIPASSFIAAAVVAALREKKIPAANTASILNRLPIVDLLRKQVNQDDLLWIIKVLNVEKEEIGGFYLSLLRNFDTQVEVQEFLRNSWEEASPFLRAHLMWRILDDPELSEEWHQKLFEFVQANWEVFDEVSVQFLGSKKTIITQALKRIGDPTFPDSKKWAYLCRVPGVAEDKEAAKALVNMGLLFNDTFTQRVARALLDQFFPPTPNR